MRLYTDIWMDEPSAVWTCVAIYINHLMHAYVYVYTCRGVKVLHNILCARCVDLRFDFGKNCISATHSVCIQK